MKKNTLIIILMVNIFNVMAYDFEVDGIFYNIISEEDKTVEVTYKETLNGGHSWLCNYEGIFVFRKQLFTTKRPTPLPELGKMLSIHRTI